MATLNQYKLISLKSKKYFNLLEKELDKNLKIDNDIQKSRIGFYLYMLECITNVKDINDLVEMVTDTEFNKIVFSGKHEDLGIDAIYIDEDTNEINLFNFKYRETFSEKKEQSENDIIISTKFTNGLIAKDISHFNGKLKEYAEGIIEKFESKNPWKLKLFCVSNDNVGIDINNKIFKNLKSIYDLEVISITLDDISKFTSIRPQPINSTLVLHKNAILAYSENSLSSSNSYVIKTSIPELIRITCEDKNLREKYNLEDYSLLNEKDCDYGVLFDNVRGYLGEKTKYNKNIFSTLENNPENFFMYNNGITITASQIELDEINGKTKVKLDLKNIQVVNGGQTLRSIYDFNNKSKDNINDFLINGFILIRIFKTSDTNDLKYKIAEYTNSQNAISIINLKSIAYEQLEIEKYLGEFDIKYSRKAGDVGISEEKEFKYRISIEKFAQILFSIKGTPENASNQKNKIFEKYYDDIFGKETFDITKSVEYIKKYYEIKKEYEEKLLSKVTDQKIFYIQYLNYVNNNTRTIAENVDLLEACINEYPTEKELSPARKLIQKGFKELLDSKLTKK